MSINLLLTFELLILPIIWFATDPRPKKERLTQYLTFKGILLIIIQYSLIYLNFTTQNTIIFDKDLEYIPIFGVILYLVGMIISIWSKLTMGKVWGRPGQHDIKRQSVLIKSGPFRFSRNPIYLGLILIFLGYSLALKSVFIILNVLLIGFFYFSVLKEETLLEKYFGKEYLKYKERVRRFI